MPKWMGVNSVTLVYIVLLVTAVALFPYSRDFVNYSDLCMGQADVGLRQAAAYYDPVFTVSCYVLSLVVQGYTIILVATLFIGLGLYFKISVFMFWRGAFWLILTFYVVRFFLLQDVTQVRAGLAAGILGAVFIALVNRQMLRAIFFSVACVAVHLSSLVVLPVVVAVTLLGARYLPALAPGIIFIVLSIYLFVCLFPSIGGAGVELIGTLSGNDSRLSFYLKNSDPVHVPLHLNFYLSIKAAFLGFFAIAEVFAAKIENDSIYRVATLSAFSLLFSLLFYQNEVLSLRLSELFSLFDAILFGWVVYATVDKWSAGLVYIPFAGLCIALLSRQILIIL